MFPYRSLLKLALSQGLRKRLYSANIKGYCTLVVTESLLLSLLNSGTSRSVSYTQGSIPLVYLALN